ncbi:Hypothetical predicted protein [Scomber scombrus]|uniref:Uncharacterized protein n=1 Tax=Scomber scombrus TaxID=13677 RepID=A0AAV1MVY9_SCOSC
MTFNLIFIVNRIYRYQEKMKNESNLLKGTQGKADPSQQDTDGAKDGNPHRKGDSEEKPSGKPCSEERSNTSRLCILL